MKKYILLNLIWFIPALAGAQVLPSPDALSGIRQSTVDLYHGAATEAVPLYEVQAENGHSVPIQLAYNTRGVRVNDIASSVGLGWSLSAGGSITRVMRDEPDEQSSFKETMDWGMAHHTIVEHKKGNDFEKDVFYFSFPGGGGRFISTSGRYV